MTEDGKELVGIKARIEAAKNGPPDCLNCVHCDTREKCDYELGSGQEITSHISLYCVRLSLNRKRRPEKFHCSEWSRK
jgi:hypothetical protein